MVLDFRKYKMKPGYSSPVDIIIYPGLQIKVLRANNMVTYHIPGGEDQYSTDITLESIPEAKKLMKDIDMFLQYRTHELPEYNL